MSTTGGHDLDNGVTLRPCHIEILHAYASHDSLELTVRVADRNTGAPREIPVTIPLRQEDTDWRAVLKEALLSFFAHEMDELLLLDGQRKDPHPGELLKTADGTFYVASGLTPAARSA